jgi:hypothetical protein
MQKIWWTLVNYIMRYYCQVWLSTTLKVELKPWTLLILTIIFANFIQGFYTMALLMRGQFNPKIELKWDMRCVWTTQKHQDFSMHVHGEFLALNHPLYNFHQWQLPWEALAKKEFTCHCHLSLKSAKLKCFSNVTIYNLPSAGMISHLGSTGWTSTIIHKTGKREGVDRYGNATKREDLRCCTLDGSLCTMRPHAKNENPLKNNNKVWEYSHTSWLDGLRL